jgi:DNA (cytosine-5)-methyltransferase 1
MKKIKVGSDFSGVGAFNQALIRLGIEYDELFACDMDKYARQTFELNYGKPKDFPKDVYEREIPKESLDIFMTSPPCQSFSLAGKRLGKEDKRGILFFNSLEFIQENKPRYFIFENVKGLLSHDKFDKKAEFGRTFQEWINYLGGKSVNGVHTFFPIEDSVPYHIYFQVLNAKHYGIPQNRERVFIIGIRDDEDNKFSFPKPFPLEKRLKDVLESEVDEKYFLSDKMINYLQKAPRSLPFTNPTEKNIANCVLANQHKMSTDQEFFKIGTWRTHEDGKGFRATEDNNCLTIPARAREDGSGQPVIKIGAIRGRVGKKVSQTLDTQCNQGIVTRQLTKQQLEKLENLEVDENVAGCITHAIGRAGSSDEYIASVKRNAMITQRIRRLTPIECFKLMDFNFGIANVPDFKWDVSDSQAYKQAGNSICVGVLAAIIEKLKL